MTTTCGDTVTVTYPAAVVQREGASPADRVRLTFRDRDHAEQHRGEEFVYTCDLPAEHTMYHAAHTDGDLRLDALARWTDQPPTATGAIAPAEKTGIWLLFDAPGDEDPSHEANVIPAPDGYRVEWYHTAVGQVSSRTFDSREEAEAFLTNGGYQDYTS